MTATPLVAFTRNDPVTSFLGGVICQVSLFFFTCHTCLCGFICYLNKNKFATNNDSGVSQELIYFYHRNSPVNEIKRCRKQCHKWYAHMLPMINTQIRKQIRYVDGKVGFWLNINTDIISKYTQLFCKHIGFVVYANLIVKINLLA